MDGFEKGDRVVRLLSVLRLFQAHPDGLSSVDVAERLGVTTRTAQRDIHALEEGLGVPFYSEDGRWKVQPGYWLKPIHLSLPEALALMLSARLALRHADKADEFAAAAYEKIAAVLPEPLRSTVVETAAGIAAKRRDPAYTRVVADLGRAWSEQRKVRVTYQLRGEFQRVLWPLFLEPSPLGHSLYLLAWDEKKHEPRSYKVERILNVELLADRFQPPAGFSPADHLAAAWGVWGADDPVEVELLFSADAARRVRETQWHPSQELESLADGGVRLRLRVGNWLELRHWVLGWGEACQVVAPAELRRSVGEAARALAAVYGSERA